MNWATSFLSSATTAASDLPFTSLVLYGLFKARPPDSQCNTCTEGQAGYACDDVKGVFIGVLSGLFPRLLYSRLGVQPQLARGLGGIFAQLSAFFPQALAHGGNILRHGLQLLRHALDDSYRRSKKCADLLRGVIQSWIHARNGVCGVGRKFAGRTQPYGHGFSHTF